MASPREQTEQLSRLDRRVAGRGGHRPARPRRHRVRTRAGLVHRAAGRRRGRARARARERRAAAARVEPASASRRPRFARSKPRARSSAWTRRWARSIGAEFELEGGVLRPVGGERLGLPGDLVVPARRPWAAVGDGFASYREALGERAASAERLLPELKPAAEDLFPQAAVDLAAGRVGHAGRTRYRCIFASTRPGAAAPEGARINRRTPPDARLNHFVTMVDSNFRLAPIMDELTMTQRKILVVEDERAIREMVAFNLGRAGYQVRPAGDGARSASRDRRRPSRSRAHGLDAARRQRARAHAPTEARSADPRDSRHHADGARRGRRPRRGARWRCRRLHREAVLAARAAGADPCRAAPARPSPKARS